MFKKILYTAPIIFLTFTLSISNTRAASDKYDITGYWSSARCFYDMPMAYFSDDGSYEMRKYGENLLPDTRMTYDIDRDRDIVLVNGKDSFFIQSEDSIIDVAGNFKEKCDIAESRKMHQRLNDYVNKKKSENGKN